MPARRPRIAWLPWSAASFARARAEGKPVLLSIAPTWCRNAPEMDRTSYADPAVVALVNARFVPIRVDADRRPDISERYSLGGWPTTAFLTPEGDVLGGGTYVERQRLRRRAAPGGRRVLPRAREPARAARAPVPQPPSLRTTSPPLDELIERSTPRPSTRSTAASATRRSFRTSRRCGWRSRCIATRDRDAHRDIAIKTLDAMGWGPLYDEQDGGFFRYAGDADWGEPNGRSCSTSTPRCSALRRRLRDAPARALRRAGGRRAALRADLAGRSGRRRMGGIAARRPGLLRGCGCRSQRRSAHRAAGRSHAVHRLERAMASAALQAGRVMDDRRCPSSRSRRSNACCCLLPARRRRRALLRRRAAGARPARRSDRDGRRAARRLRGHRQHRLRDDGGRARAPRRRTMWDERGGGFFDRAADAAATSGCSASR